MIALILTLCLALFMIAERALGPMPTQHIWAAAGFLVGIWFVTVINWLDSAW